MIKINLLDKMMFRIITKVIFKLNLVSTHSKYKKKIFWFEYCYFLYFFILRKIYTLFQIP